MITYFLFKSIFYQINTGNCQAQPQLRPPLWLRLALLSKSPPTFPPTHPPRRENNGILDTRKYFDSQKILTKITVILSRKSIWWDKYGCFVAKMVLRDIYFVPKISH